MLSIFQPARCVATVDVPYMSRRTAEYQGPALQAAFNITADLSPLFLNARLPVCANHPDNCSALEDGPILLFSPGYSIPRSYYNVLASSIASEGFTVITIDHPGDANIVVYPDGHAVHTNASILHNATWDYYPRAADASFLIDQLANATAMAELLPHRGPRPLRTTRIAMLGHSAGGAAAILAAHQDPRIRAAVNWDGSILGSPDLAGTSQPVLFLTHEAAATPDWREAWPRLDGPKRIVRVADTTHETFSDVATLLAAAGEDARPWAELLGTIAPAEMVRVLTAYTSAWMLGAFDGEEDPALWREPGGFPETSVLEEGGF